MPRTASSQIQSRSSSKARPSANVRAGNLVANTPVLFRLPAIPNLPAQDLAVTSSEAVATLPTATLAAVAISTAQPAEMPVEKSIEPSVTPQAAPKQTWWEHWSSGIVLIVLLIALATASILAWQGSGKANSKLMADTQKESESQNALSDIEVPKFDSAKLEVPKLDVPASSKANATAEKLETSSVQNSVSENKPADELDLSLIPSGSLSFDNSVPNANEAESATERTSEPEPHATASLQLPVGKQQEPLFKDSKAPSKSNISAQPASAPSQRNAANADSPSVWDSSKASARDTTKPLTLDFSSNDASSSTNSSNLSNQSSPINQSNAASEYASDTSSGTAATMISQSTSDSTAPGSADASASLVPKDSQFAKKTSTPEMDKAEYFALYRKFAPAPTPTTTAKVDNRYGAPASAGSQVQPGSTTGTSASVVGYMQPANGQPANGQPNMQPAPGNYSYTLQPTQQPITAAQNPPPQNNTQQFPTQQYQNPQYQNPQFQNQQYPTQPSQPSPQYGIQGQPSVQYPNNMQMQGTNNSSTAANQFGGAQVPYNPQPAAQPSAIQLPPGPIGGYGYSPSQPGAQNTGAQNMGAQNMGAQYGATGAVNRPTNGTANLNSTNSPSYPSLR